MTSLTAKLLGAIAALALLATGPALAAEMIGKCELYGKKGDMPFTPAKAGQLTVEVNLPAPAWWNGDSPELVKDGFEYCMAANIAHHGGFDKVEVVNVAWDALVAGQTKDFDLALSQASITEERKKVVDFSVPYFKSDIGVLAKKGTKVDAAGMKTMQIGVQEGTTGATFAADTLKPTKSLKVFPDTPTMFTALQAGQIDVALTDTAIVLGQANESKGKQVVVAQYSTGEVYGAIYPKGSANGGTIDKIILAMEKDGTLKKLDMKYLASAWGKDPTVVPYFKP